MSKKNKRTHAATGKTIQPLQAKKESISGLGSGFKSMTNWMIVLVLILPVLFSRETMDPALAVRYILLGSFMLLFILFFFLFQKTGISFSFPLLIKAVFAAGIAFCLWSIISLFSAINPVTGYYEVLRQLLNVLLLFLTMVMVKREGSNVLRLCKALMLVSIVQSFVGILQYYGVAFTDLPGGDTSIPFGLMTNRNLFGSAQTFLLPFTIFVLYKGSKKWKTASVLALCGLLVSIILSQTRSAWLATLAVMAVPFILVMIFSAPNRKKWIVATLVAVAVTVAATFIILKTDTEGDLSKSVKQRAASLTSNAADTSRIVVENVNERVSIWKKTILIAKDHPVTGVGFGNWKLLVPSYGTEGLIWAKGKIIPDRPHNVYLQLAAETGLPGGFFYVLMWLLITLVAFKIILKPRSEDQRILAIVMLSGLAGFAIDCMFSFPTERIEHSLYILLMGGIILGNYNPVAEAANKDPRPLNKPILILFILLTIFNIFIGIKKYQFEMHMNYAKAYEGKNRASEALLEVEQGRSAFVNLDPNGTSLEVRSSIAYKQLKDHKNALVEINKARKYNPNSAQVYNNMGTIYTDMGQFDKAIVCYLKALKLAPEFDIVFKNLAANYFNVGNYKECIAILGKLKIEEDQYLKSLMNEAKRRMELKEK